MLRVEVRRGKRVAFVVSVSGRASGRASLALVRWIICGLLARMPLEQEPWIIINLCKLSGVLRCAALYALLECPRAAAQIRADSVLALVGLGRQSLIVAGRLAMKYPIYKTEEEAEEAFKALQAA